LYDPQQLLNLIDENKWWILSGFAIAMIFQWWWLIECIRVAKRDKVYSMPLFCTFFWFAHDTGCVIRFYDWFVVYDNWYLKCFWFGLLTAAFLELVFFAQVIKYGKDELVPGISTRAFILGLIGFQVAASVTWEYFKYVMDDPLYQFTTTPTVISYSLFGAALMFRRRSTIGQNVTMWVTFTGMTVFWYATAWSFYGEAARAWQSFAAGIVAITGGLVMTYLVSDKSSWFTRVPLPTRPAPERAVPASA
jgi:uncharacterized membrane protein